MARKKDRVVIKIGSTSVERLGQRKIVNFISRISKNYDVVLVSSGAGLRGEKIAQERGIKNLSKKLLCGLGQPELYEDYRRLFLKKGLHSMQFLVSGENNDHQLSWKLQLKEVLKNNVIPIINGNDLLELKDLSYGDNENVAYEAQVITGAKYLITITDIDGVYDSDPNKNSQAKKFRILSCKFIEEILEQKNLNHLDFYDSKGVGGMYSKLYYAKNIMNYGGGEIYITNSLRDAEVFLDEDYKFVDKKCTGTYIYRNHDKGGYVTY
ncbi:MAG TPA: hypothetical protein EYG72_03120 [Candidatus Pacebacteria bacterium]|nr:hypothetical protein [Candidatus Paceibacterota bacterium]